MAVCLCGHPKCNLLLTQALPRMIHHLSSIDKYIHISVEYIHSGYESSLNPQVLGSWDCLYKAVAGDVDETLNNSLNI